MAPREIDLQLQQALEGGDGMEVVRELLSRKADPNSPTATGRLPLDVAVEKDATALCRLLLVYQADPAGCVSQTGPAATLEAGELVQAWGKGDVPMVFATLEELVIDGASTHDVALLSLALASIDVAGGDAEQVATLLDDRRNTLLHLCALGAGVNHHGVRAEAAARLTARALLGWGVPVDGRNEKDETALLYAMRKMHANLRGRLAGVDGSVTTNEPARALLEARADVETVDPQTRESLLMLAAKEGDLAACQLLLEFRADPLRQNTQGQTAINLCSNRQEVALALRSSLLKSRESDLLSFPTDPRGVQAQPALFDTDVSAAALAKDVRKSGMAPATPVKRDPVCVHLSMGDDQEQCSAEGLLNQVDLEESYDTDWNAAQVRLGDAYEKDWRQLTGG